MKKNIAVLLLAVMFSWTSVDAASLCSYEKQSQINKDASNIKITYEEAYKELEPGTYSAPEGEDPETFVAYEEYFKIKLLNITENVYVKLENSVNDEIKYIEYKDTDEGTFTIAWNDLTQVTTFNYTIYSSEATDCPNEQYRQGVMTLPKLNEYYVSEHCSGISDFYLCQKYITTNVTPSNFIQKVNAYKKNNKQEDEKEDKKDEINEKSDKTITTIVVTSVIVLAGVITIVIVRKKQRSRVI